MRMVMNDEKIRIWKEGTDCSLFRDTLQHLHGEGGNPVVQPIFEQVPATYVSWDSIVGVAAGYGLDD
jgi:hypothetical protein